MNEDTSKGRVMSPKKEYYDVTPQQREIALWRDAKRRELRELYLKDSGHPTKSLLVRVYTKKIKDLTFININDIYIFGTIFTILQIFYFYSFVQRSL